VQSVSRARAEDLGQGPSVPAAPAPPSFQSVYDGYVDYVWRTVCRLGVRGAAVDDVTQEVFVVVHRKLGEFEGRASLKTWLFQIARRAVHDYRRTLARKGLPEGSGAEVDAIAADPRAGPDASASRSQAVRLLYELLDKLDDEKREVFILADIEQLPAPEIAWALGIKPNTVYSRLRLAREAFNVALARHRARGEWRTE
jgi:RNA polymerase sigma-70 factor (ECF subfamily)